MAQEINNQAILKKISNFETFLHRNGMFINQHLLISNIEDKNVVIIENYKSRNKFDFYYRKFQIIDGQYIETIGHLYNDITEYFESSIPNYVERSFFYQAFLMVAF